MDFTEPYKHSQFLTIFSPNAKYLASYHLAQEGFSRLHPSAPIQPLEDGAGQGAIIIRFSATMSIMRVIEIQLFRDSLPSITEIGWSPDSTMILAASPVTGTIHVYSVEDEEFKAVITIPGRNTSPRVTKAALNAGYTPPGAECLRGARFSADSRHVLVWEDHLLRMTIWSLESSFSLHQSFQQHSQPHGPQHFQQKVYAIERPKASSRSSVSSFSIPPYSNFGTTATTATGPSAQYAFALRADLQYLAIVERRRPECKDYVSIYATEDYWSRQAVHSFCVQGLVDVEGIAWSPDGRHLAVWENPLLGFKVAIYTMDGTCHALCEVRTEDEPVIPGLAPSSSVGGGGMGVKSICWHPNSKLLALGGYDQKIRILNNMTWSPILEFQHTPTVNYGPSTVLWREADSTVPAGIGGSVRIQGGVEYNMPTTLWIWSLTKPGPVAIIQQQSPIRVCRWDLENPSRIVWCCGTSRIYSWKADPNVHGGMIEAIEVPIEQFEITSIRWSPDGKGVLLLDKDMFCLGFPVDEESQNATQDTAHSIFGQR
ncbi:WD repeat-containing protein wrap73 [Lunasporangiospora selenospora]|uniref:WD repeat-containing protein wrap73 n=1 Tax=Lunasporangiospora selenospora TaxID=979761 RepID=A0A9P6FVF1_9FUNG|nr:WD repeat-containing protein wrap73 [Lunasporangiospora selenospora]